jgi:hypothetical protein
MLVTLPEVTAAAIRALATRDLDDALATVRGHLRSHPKDAPLLGELASVIPTDPTATAKFRTFIRDVIADAMADEQRELPNGSSLSGGAKECA